MNSPVLKLAAIAATAFDKPDATVPAFIATGRDTIEVRAETTIHGVAFPEATVIRIDPRELVAGVDYLILLAADRTPIAVAHGQEVEGAVLIGGFHFAPGGNAAARSGGDTSPAINPYSIWDSAFRPACDDPRGMTLVDTPSGRFWADIYLCAADHLAGTSRFGATIADGNDPPEKPAGGRYIRFDFDAANDVMAHHGKGLLGIEESFAAYYGVTEKTAVGKDPRVTGLDAPRTSKWGVMQATGNLWAWGHDGDPDNPRASFFGGSWLSGVSAGSRCADVAYWPEYSLVNIGARGRCDHLQPV